MECYNCERWREKYNDLVYRYERLQRNYKDLQERHSKIDTELDSANFKIRTELEPRIQSEKRAYDRWVTNPER